VSAPVLASVATAASVPSGGAGPTPGGSVPAGSGAVPPSPLPAARAFGTLLRAAIDPPPAAARGDAQPRVRVPSSTSPGAMPARDLPAPPRGPAAAALDVLGRLDGARARLDAVLAEARRGRSFSASELLCLQADAHRFAQTVEIVARAAEHGVQGVKQAVHAQV
jgi:hypothetical protein